MIAIKDWMEIINYKITEGYEFGWDTFGDNAFCLSSWNGDQDGWSTNITFDTKTQVVYSIETCDYKNSKAYRLIHPDYIQAYRIREGQLGNAAWDDVFWTDLELAEDIMEKTKSIVNNEPYSARVSVPLELDDDEIFKLMTLAHEQDITLNQLVENILKEVIEKEKNENRTII